MPDYHFEEYVYLAGLTHKTAVIAWGGFFFRVHDNGTGFKLVDDGDLDHVFPPRDETIGERSRSYGPALVTLYDALSGEPCQTGVATLANHLEFTLLRSDTLYRYEVKVNGRPGRPAYGPRCRRGTGGPSADRPGRKAGALSDPDHCFLSDPASVSRIPLPLMASARASPAGIP